MKAFRGKVDIEQEERLPFSGSNSINLVVRISEELDQSLKDGAALAGVTLPVYVRRLLHTGSFYFLARNHIKKLKAEYKEGTPQDPEGLAAVFKKLDGYYAAVKRFVAEIKELEKEYEQQEREHEKMKEKAKARLSQTVRHAMDSAERVFQKQ